MKLVVCIFSLFVSFTSVANIKLIEEKEVNKGLGWMRCTLIEVGGHEYVVFSHAGAIHSQHHAGCKDCTPKPPVVMYQADHSVETDVRTEVTCAIAFGSNVTIKPPEEDDESLVRHRNRAGIDTSSEKMVYYEQEEPVPEVAKALCEEKTAQNATGYDTRHRPKGTLAAGLGQRPNRRGESLRQAAASSARRKLTTGDSGVSSFSVRTCTLDELKRIYERWEALVDRDKPSYITFYITKTCGYLMSVNEKRISVDDFLNKVVPNEKRLSIEQWKNAVIKNLEKFPSSVHG